MEHGAILLYYRFDGCSFDRRLPGLSLLDIISSQRRHLRGVSDISTTYVAEPLMHPSRPPQY